MFTGIIEDIGTLQDIRATGEVRRIKIGCDTLPLTEVRIGDSISVNGACLTVVSKKDRIFEADISPETLQKTTFGHMKTSMPVNLERALMATGRLDGHIVQGHVDGVATIIKHQKIGSVYLLEFEVPSFLSDGMVEKGSVAVDGISLTINDCADGFFSVSIIPLTAKKTTLGQKKVGDKVHIETDMIGKYLRKSMENRTGSDAPTKTELDVDFLVKTGFI